METSLFYIYFNWI